MRHTSAGRGISGTDLVGHVTSLDTIVNRGCLARVSGRPSIRVTQPRLAFLEPHGGGGSEGLGFILAPEAPLFRGMPTVPEGFLGMLGASGLRPCVPTRLKKALCHTRLLDGVCNKYC